MNFLADNLNKLIWPRFISPRENPKPENPAWIEFRRDSRDGGSIFGRCLRAGDDARGTLVFVHGFTKNGGVFRDLAYQLRDRLGMCMITPDIPHRGLSGDRPQTGRTAEL